jgi:trimeric autotransporter adhesin
VRRLVSLLVLIFFTVPFGLSVAGCSKSTPAQFCNGLDSGPVVGQVASITLSATLATTDESLSYGQIGQALNANAIDCKGNAVSVKSFTYATSDTSLTNADINPGTGSVCAGSWNRNSGSGIADFTTCTAPKVPSSTHLYFVTATGNGATSNAIPVYVHSTVTSVTIGAATPACSNGPDPTVSDPSSECCPTATTAPSTNVIYDGVSCISQGQTRRLVAKVYTNGTTNPADNITCDVGNLSFAAQGTNNIVTIDESGVATAQQPGSATITATVSSSGSADTAGYFSTCPPASIVLTAQGQPNPQGPISVALNNTQPFTAQVLDTLGQAITGLTLEYTSTTPETLPGAATVTPIFPGSATITAVCQPGNGGGCNPAPFSQIGLNGNGKPITSNGITVNTVGSSSTVLYVASTQSQYLYPLDFTTNQQPPLVKLPYVPNSMVITENGSTIFMGSTQALMTFATSSNSVTSANTNVVGSVLAVSPDGSTLVVTDPTRQTITLVSSTGTITATYNGVGTHAEWSPDSQTVYITGTAQSSTPNTLGPPQLLVHSIFNGWTAIAPLDHPYNDVAVMVPAIGAYFAGPNSTEGRSYCSSSTLGAGTPPIVTNANYPLADDNLHAVADRLAATSDGKHILGATTTTFTDLDLTLKQATDTTVPTLAACPQAPDSPTSTPPFISTTAMSDNLAGITATSITGVVPASNSALSFVTYMGSGGVLPMYIIPSTGKGTLTSVPLTGGASLAPVAGVFSSDNLSFYAGTSGDNLVHLISVNSTASTPTAVDSSTPIVPNLPCATGSTYIVATPPCPANVTVGTPNLLVQRPKQSTTL